MNEQGGMENFFEYIDSLRKTKAILSKLIDCVKMKKMGKP